MNKQNTNVIFLQILIFTTCVSASSGSLDSKTKSNLINNKTVINKTKLNAHDRELGDYFGIDVSLSGNRALIGSEIDNSSNRSESAYIFDFDGSSWTETFQLTANDGDLGDVFGSQVSLSGNRALVGAFLDDDKGSDSGSAYVFDFDGVNWNQSAKLTASDGSLGDQFGRPVVLNGTRAFVGAHLDDDNGSNSGSVYVFEYDGINWNQTAKIISNDGEAYDLFGLDISILGSRALISARHDDDNGSRSGSVYVFDLIGTNWIQTAKLTPSDGAKDDLFGSSVSLSDNRALIGAWGNDDNGNESGSAYIFDFDGSYWIQSAKLIANNGVTDDRFGGAVSLSGNRAFVGSCCDDENGYASGAVYLYIYNNSSWIQSDKLLAYDGDSWDQFGSAVSSSSGRILIGSFGTDAGAGSAYIYTSNEFIDDKIFEDGFEFSTALPSAWLVANPTLINSGESTQLSWSVTNAVSCNKSSNPYNLQWDGILYQHEAGSLVIPNIYESTMFSIECTNYYGAIGRSVIVEVNQIGEIID